MTEQQLGKFFAHIPPLETKRLYLRKIVPGDSDDMFDYSQINEVTQYLLWDPHPDRLYTYRYLCRLKKQYRQGNFYDWAVVKKEDGRMIGTCGFTSFDLRHNRAEVGYVLSPREWGRGFAPEALLTVMAFGFRVLGLNRIEAHFIRGNDRSRRVMEKCSMTFEGFLNGYMLIKGQYRDIGICSVQRQEFEAKYKGVRFDGDRYADCSL